VELAIGLFLLLCLSRIVSNFAEIPRRGMLEKRGKRMETS